MRLSCFLISTSLFLSGACAFADDYSNSNVTDVSYRFKAISSVLRKIEDAANDLNLIRASRLQHMETAWGIYWLKGDMNEATIDANIKESEIKNIATSWIAKNIPEVMLKNSKGIIGFHDILIRINGKTQRLYIVEIDTTYVGPSTGAGIPYKTAIIPVLPNGHIPAKVIIETDSTSNPPAKSPAKPDRE